MEDSTAHDLFLRPCILFLVVGGRDALERAVDKGLRIDLPVIIEETEVAISIHNKFFLDLRFPRFRCKAAFTSSNIGISQKPASVFRGTNVINKDLLLHYS